MSAHLPWLNINKFEFFDHRALTLARTRPAPRQRRVGDIRKSVKKKLAIFQE
jgi:hypothetical protein